MLIDPLDYGLTYDDYEYALRYVEKISNPPRTLESFAREAWHQLYPDRPLIWNWHLSYLCEYLEAVARREILRLLINIPVRTSKSTFLSVLFPCWIWTWKPEEQFLTVSHSGSLATRDAVRSRMLIQSRWYQDRWSDRFCLSGDQNEKTRYENNRRGVRQASGVTAGITGADASVLLVDDLHDADQAQSDTERTNALEAFDRKLSTRLNNPSTDAIVVSGQRLHQMDIAGYLLASEEKWEHLCLPMRYEGKPRYVSCLGLDDPRKVMGELLWPERFPEDTVKRMEIRLGEYGSSGQFQQNPTPAGGGILKRDCWKVWPSGRKMPNQVYSFRSWDTAFTERALRENTKVTGVQPSYSAYTQWAVFLDDDGCYKMILTGAWRDHVSYPTLRAKALELSKARPMDVELIEKKASGISLIQDLRISGVPVIDYTPNHDGDKVARAHVIAPLLESGVLYVPFYDVDADPPIRPWAHEFIEDVSQAPYGTSWDWTDTLSQAMIRMRTMFMIRASDDLIDNDYERPKKRIAAYG